MVELIVFTKNNANKLSNYLDNKNIQYQIHRNDYEYTFEIELENTLTIIKFILKNKINYKWSNQYSDAKNMLKKKMFDEFTYFYENKIFSLVPMNELVTCALLKYDFEIVNFLLGLNICHDLRLGLASACWRNDDNVGVVKLVWDQIVFNHKNKQSKSSYYCPLNNTNISMQAFYNAVEMGNFNIVNFLVEIVGVNSYVMNDGIEIAVKYNHADIAEYLYERGARLKPYDIDIDSFFESITNNEPMTDMIEFLSKYEHNGIKLVSDDDLGKSLIIACKNGSLENVTAIIETGIDFDKYRKKALAACKEKPHIKKYLQSIVDV
ncbi:ankyrin repeat protein [Tupanvirus soda lake]|uniref:Ankyrin repeat protein n=2 Tax=Tupanvirus TaxID=2094720 RepID=A0A6N1NK43_9VIRU|nr:ankyrin repeat protein [Tupanvirus soda lake]QKU34730.1 ankyrin repeat protein [Tupanvirus soda lake]